MGRTVVTLLVVGLILGGSRAGGLEARAPHSNAADVVLEWNQLLQDTIPSNASLTAPRYYSMLHIAMFDAANSVERQYGRYLVQLPHGFGASAELAAAAAARDVLTALLPSSQPVYDAALDARLGQSPGAARPGPFSAASALSARYRRVHAAVRRRSPSRPVKRRSPGDEIGRDAAPLPFASGFELDHPEILVADLAAQHDEGSPRRRARGTRQRTW